MEVGESVAVSVVSGDQQKTCDCEWKDCKKKHQSQISYKKGGTVERNSSYSSDWVAAKLEPWEKYGNGIDSRATASDYSSEVAASYAKTAAALKHPEYHTQKHHLISVKLFKDVSSLSHNAKLITYDVNAKENGVCLPSFVVDIVRHDLQCHRGNHPNDLYYDKISPLLAELEAQCVEFCTLDSECNTEPQQKLLVKLNGLSRRIEGQLKNWKWLLRSAATAERVESQLKLLQKQSSS